MTPTAYYRRAGPGCDRIETEAVLRIVLALLALTAIPAAEYNGDLDPAFAKIPFEQWLAGTDQAPFRWTARGGRSDLTYHQRLATKVEAQIDGADLVGRRQNGELVFFIQLTDSSGRRYQDHGSIDLSRLEDGVRSQYLTYVQYAFVLPGDYAVSVAVLETGTTLHGAQQFKLHVAPLKNDPLPDAWKTLPPVEFIHSVEPPESWYQPGSKSRLDLNLRSRRPIHPEVLVNLGPSERTTSRRVVPHRDLSGIMPSLQVVSRLGGESSLPLTLLDLSRLKVVYRQTAATTLDWTRIAGALGEADPGTIDVKSLENRHQNAHFFVKEIEKRLNAPLPKDAEGTPRVLIILSGIVEFESGEDLTPVNVEQPRDCHVYYFRFRPPQTFQRPPAGMPMPGRRQRPNRGLWDAGFSPADQLAGTLKPLSPRIFDVETPDQFRKALARTLEEIAGL
jgi:hypothetical protein